MKRFSLRGLWGLVAAQLLGAFNDNLYKMIVTLAAAEAAIAVGGDSSYLSLSGVLFVLPYVLLSAYAAAVADRFDKRDLLIAAKVAEIAIVGIAAAAFLSGSIEAMLATLFLLAAQATFFSPAKYGYVAESLPVSGLSRANGVLESTRYAAVILGTAVGGFLMTLWADRPELICLVLMTLAVAGALASLAIRRTRPKRANRPARFKPWSEIADGIRRVIQSREMSLAVGGITCLESLSTLVLLDIVLFGKATLGLDDLHIGLIGGAVGIGATAGSLGAGRLSNGRPALGLSLIGVLGVALTLPIIAAAGNGFVSTAAIVGAVGVFGGLALVPLMTLLQHAAPAQEKGRFIAINNLANMTGVLIASGGLWLLHDVCGLSARWILAVAGVAALPLVVVLARRAARQDATAWLGCIGARLSPRPRYPSNAAY
jgi:acyl-[acyl-carrier-protein]-phospholipid O-acyltransferase/long-chain-fatty-acid--[acyl-carrier-protein] ligase